jgi:hypothetical protein
MHNNKILPNSDEIIVLYTGYNVQMNAYNSVLYSPNASMKIIVNQGNALYVAKEPELYAAGKTIDGNTIKVKFEQYPIPKNYKDFQEIAATSP